MAALVSVIIPVYNLEEYIEHCVKSMLNQTYENLEILCVDDGSTDSSAEIIKNLCKSDSRVKYIHKDNGGVSSARNKGLKIAEGDYIMFVDGDDYMHTRAVEVFVDCIEHSGYGMVCAAEINTFEKNSVMNDFESYACEETNHEGLFTYKYGSVLGKSVWSKIFVSDVAKSVEFNENFSTGEDANYIVRILAQGIKVGVVDKNLYYYYARENSCVTSAFTKKKFSITLSFDDLCDFLKNSEFNFLKGYCLQYLFQSIFYNRTSAIGTDSQQYVLSECKRIGKKWIKEFKKNDYIDSKIRFVFVLFFYSRHFYELARMIKDPTMIDFYKRRLFKKFQRKG